LDLILFQNKKTMELVEIISNVLIFGGALLFFVVMISFILSKMKREENPAFSHRPKRLKKSKIETDNTVNDEQGIFRKNQNSASPQIFQLDNARQREIKIIRKPTALTRERKENSRPDSNLPAKTEGNGTRYTIVNDELKKSPIKAANFYL
jgi:hypothetical protein